MEGQHEATYVHNHVIPVAILAQASSFSRLRLLVLCGRPSQAGVPRFFCLHYYPWLRGIIVNGVFVIAQQLLWSWAHFIRAAGAGSAAAGYCVRLHCVSGVLHIVRARTGWPIRVRLHCDGGDGISRVHTFLFAVSTKRQR